MDHYPTLAKAHSQRIADEYLRLGWTKVHEFRTGPEEEPYEYLFQWTGEGPPPSIDWSKFTRSHGNA